MMRPEDFMPPWYLRNGHVQTILTGFYKPKPPLPPTIEHKVALHGGDKGYTLVYENRPSQLDRANADEGVLLLHGLGSSHAGTYMTTLAGYLLQRGVRVFRIDLPGAGPSGRFTPLPPHGACFDEVWEALQHLHRVTGIRRWRLSGVSLGGNILLKMLIEKRSSIDTGCETRELSVLKAIAVAPPIRLSDCSSHMEQGVHQLYARYFMRALRKQAVERAKIWPEWAKQLPHANYSTIRRFDESITAPLAGFRNAEEYYAAGSSAAWLDQIEVNTLILVDTHDPIVPVWMFDQAVLSASTTLRRTHFGGHVGYLTRTEARSKSHLHRWADAWIANELFNQASNSP
jgi:uncharacterized protein